MHRPHILLFDLYAGGHHGHYVRQLVEYWGRLDEPGRLDIVVPPTFTEIHPDVQCAVERYTATGVRLIPIDEPVHLRQDGPLYLVHNDRVHGRVLHRSVSRLQPDVAVCMYVDHVQLSLAFDLTFPFPVHLAGIYFRPSFHYGDFSNSTPNLKEQLTRFRKRMILAAALRNRHFSHLFCLDPYVVPYAQALNRRVKAVALPDGITPRPPQRSRSETRARWAVSENRKVALLFGVIDGRKGVYRVLEAVQHLSIEAQQQLALVLAGPIRATEQERVGEGVAQVKGQTAVQVIVDDRFIPDEEIQDVVRAADLALITYQRHLGSSNVLVRAAAEAVPVLGSDYGVVGEHVRRHELGLPVDATSSSAIAQGLTRWLASPDAFPFDAPTARRFAAEHTTERYAATLLHPFLDPNFPTAEEPRLL